MTYLVAADLPDAPAGRRFRALLDRPGILAIPGTHNGMASLQARAAGFEAVRAEDLQAAVGRADIVSCATLATEPLVRGAWLRPGTHLDLIGAFTPAMREADAEAVARAAVFVDTEAAMAEAGELAGLPASEVRGTLATLCRGGPARGSAGEVTLFKSVGAAIEDLAAAVLAWSGVR